MRQEVMLAPPSGHFPRTVPWAKRMVSRAVQKREETTQITCGVTQGDCKQLPAA